MKICLKCGATDRNPSGKCVPCQKVRNTAWYSANREKAIVKAAIWKTLNPEKVRASGMASAARYRAVNPGKHQAAQLAWSTANREWQKAKSAAYRAVNPEKVKDAMRAWRESNPDATRAHTQNRRARKRAVGGKLSPDLALSLYISQEGKCACCGKPLGDTYHLDHIMPLALGGTNTDGNIQLLLPRCNMSKGAKHPDAWLTQIAKAGTVRASVTQTGHPE